MRVRIRWTPEVAKAAPAMGPPPKRNRKTYPFQGTIQIPGLPLIRIETPKGEFRRGVDRDGKPWAVRMPAHYGELAGSEGADGDPLDVFVGEHAHEPFVYVVHVRDPESGEYDEDKTFVGFRSKTEVLRTFAAAYTRPGFRGGIRKLSFPAFAAWLADRKSRGEKITAGEALKGAPHGGIENLLRWED